ncbi:unnamed protein product [Durusdinium trenchii]|uniref:Uncharacterized protein n=1 Tax=Durusdinium trenchii TaxID=1381693 RepID=A0ABP0JP18_9DINO
MFGSWLTSLCESCSELLLHDGAEQQAYSAVCIVLLCNGSDRLVHPAADSKLERQEEPVSFEVGDYAILDGFTERTSLNGEPVELLRWDEEKQGWVVQSQIEDVKRLVSLQNIKPYPRRQATPAPKKDREFNIVSFLATILGTIIIGGTAIAVLGVLGLAFYKDWTGEYLLTLDGLPSTT